MAYPTLAQAKVFLGISGSGDDTSLTQILNGVIKTVERRTGRVFVAAAETRYFSVRSPYVNRDPLALNLFADLVSVTTLTNGDAEVITSAYYNLISLTGAAPYYRVELKPGNGYVWRSDGAGGRVSIAGTWGYSAACPADLFLAIMEQVGNVAGSRAQGGGVTVTKGGFVVDYGQWPEHVREVVESYKR